MHVLITGGAGYIGSIMTKVLLDRGFEVTVTDSLERGRSTGIDKRAKFIKGNLLDKTFLKQLFINPVESVIHFAGYISMGESMHSPLAYFENNVSTLTCLLEAMNEKNLKKIVFSSTAGVYGNPRVAPIRENEQINPTNPYGESKSMGEKILSWCNKAYGLNFVALRYFNAAGATLDGKLGESHNPETHIIPNAIFAAMNDKEFTLYGDDYDTADGTCVRDYIHVLDLAEAHLLALEKLSKDKGGFIYNVGTGKGYSNKEVIDMVKKITMRDITIKASDRREGDADRLIADPEKIKSELGFKPQHSDLETIVKTSFLWFKAYHT